MPLKPNSGESKLGQNRVPKAFFLFDSARHAMRNTNQNLLSWRNGDGTCDLRDLMVCLGRGGKKQFVFSLSRLIAICAWICL